MHIHVMHQPMHGGIGGLTALRRAPPAPGAYFSASARIVVSWSHSTRKASWPFVERISR
jgi:hypothetical protein